MNPQDLLNRLFKAQRVIRATDQEIDAFEDCLVCQHAAKKVVEEAVTHWEKAKRRELAYWHAFHKKHGLDDSVHVEYDHTSRTFKVYEKEAFELKRVADEERANEAAAKYYSFRIKDPPKVKKTKGKKPKA